MKFSFVILTWNRKKFLHKCISALTESIGGRDDSEIIVMDNGSDDGTREYLDELKNDPRFRIVRLKKNYGLNAYKKLFRLAKGEFIVEIDDDVILFPNDIATVFDSYMAAFPEFGYLALDVIQNEFTNGAKPPAENYQEIERDGKVVQDGPTGGWCTCFRRSDYRKIRLSFFLKDMNMRTSEDGMISGMFREKLKLKSGIIKDVFCFHASGPHYSKEFGCLERDIEKYRAAGLDSFVDMYSNFR